jgi:hypothetical protein
MKRLPREKLEVINQRIHNRMKHDSQCTYNVILKRVRVTIVAVEKSNKYCITYSECACSLSYPACKAHAPYYNVICGLSGSNIIFHIIS